ncbi:unnamed protein product [Urochloa decumbens]|uniref:Acidic protein n=1 Tax=Urochloa decumbens TaxID=240449 RepID=A0ABC9ANE9_9POAL
MGSKGVNSVLISVLLLGLVLEQAQVEGVICCRNTAARNCFLACVYTGEKYAVQCIYPVCDCINQSYTHTCPSQFPKLNFLPRLEESDRVEYCSIGCRSLICDSKDNVGEAEDVKILAERCGYVCDRFCNGDTINTPVVA